MRPIDLARTYAASRYGVISLEALFDFGVGRWSVDRMVAEGALRSVHTSVYMFVECPASPTALLVCLTTYLGPGAVATARSAAGVWRMKVAPPDLPQILLPRRQRYAAVRDAEIHTTNRIAPVDSVVESGVPVTSAARTVIELAADMRGDIDLGDLIISTVRRGLLSRSLLESRANELRRPGHAGPKRVLDALGRLAPGVELAESVLEDKFIGLIVGSDLGMPVMQHSVCVTGASYRLDFAYPEVKLGIECDGYRWHSSPAQLDRDRTRKNSLQSIGWTVLSYTYSQIVDKGDSVVAEIERTYARLARDVIRFSGPQEDSMTSRLRTR